MKANTHNTPALRAFRSIASVVLGSVVIAIVWNGIVKRNQTAAQTKQQGSILASLWDSVIAKTQVPDSTANPRNTQRVHQLEGRFTPGNEAVLIEQLSRTGYINFFSYQLNADGSARIDALHGQQAIQPIEAINVGKDGKAEVAK